MLRDCLFLSSSFFVVLLVVCSTFFFDVVLGRCIFWVLFVWCVGVLGGCCVGGGFVSGRCGVGEVWCWGGVVSEKCGVGAVWC